MKEYVPPSRKVIKFNQPHQLESENTKQLPTSRGPHGTLKPGQPSPQGPRLLLGRAVRNTFITPSPCTQLGHFSLKNVWTRNLTNTFQSALPLWGYLWTMTGSDYHFCILNWPEVKELYSQILPPETAMSKLTTELVTHWATFRRCDHRKKDQSCLQLDSESILPQRCSCPRRA